MRGRHSASPRYESESGASAITEATVGPASRGHALATAEIRPDLVYAFRFVDPGQPGVELLSLLMPAGVLATSKSAATGQHDTSSPFTRAAASAARRARDRVRHDVVHAASSNPQDWHFP